jgi:hypothetical protein
VRKLIPIIEILNRVDDQQRALLIFALTKTARIRIFHNMDEGSRDRAIRSLNGKAVYNGGKQMGAVALGSYGAYPLDWIKFEDSCASCKKKYSFGDEIWRANCWDHTYHGDCLLDHYTMNCIQCQVPPHVIHLQDRHHLQELRPTRIKVNGLIVYPHDQIVYAMAKFTEEGDPYWYKADVLYDYCGAAYNIAVFDFLRILTFRQRPCP